MTQTRIGFTTYRQQLTQFRERYIPLTISVQNTNWMIYDTGGNRFPLLLLAGGGGRAETLFPQVLTLAKDFRVIVVDIPTHIRTMDRVVDDLSTLLNALDISQVHVYGISLGGHIAQVFLRKYYARVRDVVLSHTAIPTEEQAQKTAMQYRLLQFYPKPVMLKLFRRSFYQQIDRSTATLSEQERTFWMSYLTEQYNSKMSRDDILSRVAIARDYFQHFTFHTADLNYWSGRMLIIESSDGDVYDEGQRGSLLSMYPRAWLHTFIGYGHLATVLAQPQSAEIVADFLKGDAYDGV